ncbi:hypothetical protein [Chitinophaga sedimenti]|nr:hypothetical protein [Chitinophaga sedimenti]
MPKAKAKRGRPSTKKGDDDDDLGIDDEFKDMFNDRYDDDDDDDF